MQEADATHICFCIALFVPYIQIIPHFLFSSRGKIEREKSSQCFSLIGALISS